jgi:hypothetical protein
MRGIPSPENHSARGITTRVAASYAATRFSSALCARHLMPLGILQRPGRSRPVVRACSWGCVRADPQGVDACLYRLALSTCLTPYTTHGGTRGMYSLIRICTAPFSFPPRGGASVGSRSARRIASSLRHIKALPSQPHHTWGEHLLGVSTRGFSLHSHVCVSKRPVRSRRRIR